MRKHRKNNFVLPLVEKICFFFFLVIVGPVKAAYVPPGEDQAIRSSFLVSESGSGCAFTFLSSFFFGYSWTG